MGEPSSKRLNPTKSEICEALGGWMDTAPEPLADEPKTPEALLAAYRQACRENNRLAIENHDLHRQLGKFLGMPDPGDGEDEESQAAREIKAEVVQALRDMLPQAKRAAKRGKPALLRLIVRTIRTKL
jgi:hypothetical protein